MEQKFKWTFQRESCKGQLLILCFRKRKSYCIYIISFVTARARMAKELMVNENNLLYLLKTEVIFLPEWEVIKMILGANQQIQQPLILYVYKGPKIGLKFEMLELNLRELDISKTVTLLSQPKQYFLKQLQMITFYNPFKNHFAKLHIPVSKLGATSIRQGNHKR